MRPFSLLITVFETLGRPMAVSKKLATIQTVGGRSAISRFIWRATVGSPTQLFAHNKGLLVRLMLKLPN